MADSILITGEVKISVEIRCKVCLRLARSTHRATLTQHSVHDLPRLFSDRSKMPMPTIPAGWQMNGRDNIRCEEHHL